MKTIGLIGGMSWEASARYYKFLNIYVKDKLGGTHSGEIIMYSVDFYELEILQRSGRWIEASNMIAKAAKRLELAGADFIIICSVTGHERTGIIENEINIPLLHIADAVNEQVQEMDKVGLIGTIYTMEKEYFKKYINTEIIIPNEEDRKFINDVIYNEIVKGELRHPSRDVFKNIIKNLGLEGAEGVILGCTEIGLLINQWDCNVPLFDTTILHSKAAVNYALGDKQ